MPSASVGSPVYLCHREMRNCDSKIALVSQSHSIGYRNIVAIKTAGPRFICRICKPYPDIRPVSRAKRQPQHPLFPLSMSGTGKKTTLVRGQLNPANRAFSGVQCP